MVSLAKRWLLGTHQGSVEPAHVASYLNEFVFRFNRRRSRSRGMVFYRVLELAVAHDPVRDQDLIATRRPRAVRPTPPQVRGHPPTARREAGDAVARCSPRGRAHLSSNCGLSGCEARLIFFSSRRQSRQNACCTTLLLALAGSAPNCRYICRHVSRSRP